MTSEYLDKLQQGLTPTERLYQIVEHSMCIGCGICQSIAGPQTVTIEMVANHVERPLVHGELDHQTMDRIVSVCPGTRVEGLPAALIDEQTSIDTVWGAWQEIYYSYSAEPGVRHLASTGGLLTGLGLYLIESATVDFILQATASTKNPAFGEACISRTRDDVLRAAGSRYGPTATLKNIVEVINQADAAGEKFAFIGTPCDVSALRNYAEYDSRVDELCRFMLTMVCGGFMAPTAVRAFLESRDIDPDEVVSLRYRGHGCPGPTTVKTANGSIHEFSYLDFWGEDETAWQLPPRCKICPDGIGDAADIAAADTWEGGTPTALEIATDPGSNAAIIRTKRGAKLMQNAIADGYLVRGDALTPTDMNRFQPHQEAKKRSAWARFNGLREAGKMVPDTTGLRLQELSKQNHPADNIAQSAGATLRTKQGKFSEPTPVKLSIK